MSGNEEIGNVEERYDVMGLFDDGGQGDLYVGRDRRTGEKVAVKTQKPWRMGPGEFFREAGDELTQEGSLMLNLGGIDGIPEIMAVGRYKGRRCLVMEFIEGRQLGVAVMERRPVKDPGVVASVIGQLCEILHEVHEKKLVHCDLKPENVIVEPNGRLRLLDVGHAVWMGEATCREHGTFGYAAPEQWDANSHGLTRRADIFGLGCILLEMTVMRLPYGGLEERVSCGFPVLPPDRLAVVPSEFRDLALQMVAWHAEDRPADVREVFERIRPYLPAPGSRRPSKPLKPDTTEYYRTCPPRL
ncbi:serine/threonine protein kinase [Streptomyces achromogenes]|uniref:serine/threonine protein kinase n=1 Tax=Streptomyces achromogenes TaxID=67255 RepID=UPI0036A3C0CA